MDLPRGACPRLARRPVWSLIAGPFYPSRCAYVFPLLVTCVARPGSMQFGSKEMNAKPFSTPSSQWGCLSAQALASVESLPTKRSIFPLTGPNPPSSEGRLQTSLAIQRPQQQEQQQRISEPHFFTKPGRRGLKNVSSPSYLRLRSSTGLSPHLFCNAGPRILALCATLALAYTFRMVTFQTNLVWYLPSVLS